MRVPRNVAIVMGVITLVGIFGGASASAGFGPQSSKGSSAASPEVRKKLQVLYDKMGRLAKTKNVNGLVAVFTRTATPDFLYYDKQGYSKDRSEMAKDMKKQFQMVTSVATTTNKIVKIKPAKNGYNVTVKSVYDMKAKNPSTGKSMRIQGNSISIDTWVKTGSDLKLKQVEITRESYMIDGKKVD